MTTDADGVTLSQCALLLALSAAYDQRTIGDADVKAWHAAATDHCWTWDSAERVIREHYGQGADRPRLEVPAITDRIRQIRRRAIETFELPRIPDGLANSDYPGWLRHRRDAHAAALVHRWATTGQEPPTHLPPSPPPNQIGQRRLAELTAGAFRNIPAASLDGNPPTIQAVEGRRSAFAVACPYCSARAGHPCTRSGASGRVRMKHPHPTRGTRPSSEEAS